MLERYSSLTETGGYEYANSRIRARMGLLFESSRLQGFLLKGMDDVIAELQKTNYQAQIGIAIVTDLTIEGLDDALRLNLANDFAKIRTFFGGEGRQLIEGVLSSWDIYNVKTVLRGKSVGVGERDIMSAVIPAGEIGDDSIKELAKQPVIKNVVDLLVTWRDPLGTILNRKLESYVKSQDLSVFEHALDEFYFGEALLKCSNGSKSSRFTREFIRSKIDISNLITLLKSVKERVPTKVTADLFFDGGLYLTKDWLTRQNDKSDLGEVLSELKKTFYGFAIGGASDLAVDRVLVNFEEALNRYLVRKMVRLKYEDPFTVASALSYINAKINEVKNLRIILRGLAFNLPPDKIEEELYFV